MGRSKEQLKKIHGKRVRKVKEMVRKYCKGELPYTKLTALAKKFLEKRKKKEKKPA